MQLFPFNGSNMLRYVNMTSPLRIAHLSDPHFFTFDSSPQQFFSKRWVGNFNFLLSRRRHYSTSHLTTLPNLFNTLNIRYLFITGDFASTSLDQEFTAGRQFYYKFLEQGIATFAVPGNHDVYTKGAQEKKRYYSFFPSKELRDKKAECIELEQNWWYVGLDCAIKTPPFFSYGRFSEETEGHLHELLIKLPEESKVIVACHFPLFTTGHPLHDLKRGRELQRMLKRFPQVKLYLHGHDHTPYIIEHSHEKLPLTLNSGSCAKSQGGSFYLIDLLDRECLVTSYVFRGSDWKAGAQTRYLWPNPN